MPFADRCDMFYFVILNRGFPTWCVPTQTTDNQVFQVLVNDLILESRHNKVIDSYFQIQDKVKIFIATINTLGYWELCRHS